MSGDFNVCSSSLPPYRSIESPQFWIPKAYFFPELINNSCSAKFGTSSDRQQAPVVVVWLKERRVLSRRFLSFLPGLNELSIFFFSFASLRHLDRGSTTYRDVRGEIHQILKKWWNLVGQFWTMHFEGKQHQHWWILVPSTLPLACEWW